MAKKKKKAYVVWVGREKGVFDSWETCKKQVDKYVGAKFKGFKSREEAEKAYKEDYKKYIAYKKKPTSDLKKQDFRNFKQPIKESIAVDGACDTSTGLAEYQGVANEDGTLLFHKGPFEDGTNNIVEFLAIVHALAYCKKNSIDIPIYSDSKIAIGWVKNKLPNTSHQKNNRNKHLFDLLDRAKKWLESNDYPNKILKWETKIWGENPADFGRK